MKRAAFCVMVVLAGSLVLSAQNTFVVDFDSVQMGHNAPAYSVVELNDGGFLVGGIQRWHNGDTTGRTHVILRRTDAWGRVIGERALHYNVNRTYNNGLFGAMVRSDTVLVSGITTYGPAPYECTLYLYWFNEDGDTVATKRLLSYSTADSSFIQHWQTVRTMDGGYALCGVFGPPNENGQAIIVRTDVQGDTLWARTYGYPNQEENAYSICELADGGFAITAIELGTGPQNPYAHPGDQQRRSDLAPAVRSLWLGCSFRAHGCREVDQRHLITVGLVDWSLDRPGLTSGFVPKEIGEELDFLCVHLYHKSGKQNEDLETLRGFDIGKPVVIEEMFPLGCRPGELAEFVLASRVTACGWISFYWGRTPEELRNANAKTLGEALLQQWLEEFVKLTPQFMAPAKSD